MKSAENQNRESLKIIINGSMDSKTGKVKKGAKPL